MKKLLSVLILIVLIIAVIPFSASAYTIAKPLVVVLDPGHGGKDSGAIYPQNSKNPIACEREINLKIAKTIKQELSKYKNVVVYLTREDNQTELTLTQRGYFAGKKHADILISLHCNSDWTDDYRGAEVWYPRQCSFFSSAYTLGDKLATDILSELELLGINIKGKYTRDSTKPTERYKDGSLMDYYTVINSSRQCYVTGIIVEHAYINNKQDYESFLSDDSKLEALGIADAKAIVKCFGITDEEWLFNDVQEGDNWVSSAVKYVKENGIFSGYQNGCFGTDDPINRQDFVVVLSKMAGADLGQYEKESQFPDVDIGNYYTAAINWAYENKIVSGYENGNFGVGDSITRQDLLTMLYKYANNYLSLNIQSISYISSSYPDCNDVSEYAIDSVNWALEKGVISGVNGTHISPKTTASRVQLAQMIKSINEKEVFKN